MPVFAGPFFVGGTTSEEDMRPITGPAPEFVVECVLVPGAWDPASLCARAAVIETGATRSADERRRQLRRSI
jgi:hypothetical protein